MTSMVAVVEYDLHNLIERSRNGDWQAFADLVRQHQQLAFGCAFARLGDFQLAEDATQEAFVTAYLQLSTLRSADAFAWWLRSIVRHQCNRILRGRRATLVSLDDLDDFAASTPGPDERALARSDADEVVVAINTLPLVEREVLALFYAQDASRKQIAAFLDVPLTTVNNRLHSARAHLKRRLIPMAKETFAAHALPSSFPTKVGTLLEIRGPVVEMKFDERPPLLSLIAFGDEQQNASRGFVAQQLDDGTVRGVVIGDMPALQPGSAVTFFDTPIDAPLDSTTLGTVMHRLVENRPSTQPEMIETGIKCIDVFAPLQRGGTAAVLGPMGIGKMVVIQEVLQNLRDRDRELVYFTFVRSGAEADLVRGSIDEMLRFDLRLAQMVTLTASDPRDIGTLADSFDSVLTMSIARATNNLWPAVDVVRSASRLLVPEVVGREHVEVAAAARDLLRSYRSLRARIQNEEVYHLTPDDKLVLARGRRLDCFLTQRFAVAEEFTGHPGVHVSVADSVRGCAAILRGECDDVPEAAFMWSGTIEDVRAKATA